MSFEVQTLTWLQDLSGNPAPLHNAREIAPDLATQALKLVNEINVWNI